MSRALDRLVAMKVMDLPEWMLHDEHVFGGKECVSPEGETHNIAAFDRYSTDIAAAWEVVEAMDVGHNVMIRRMTPLSHRTIVEFIWKGPPRMGGGARNGKGECGPIDKTPLAICLAALRAKGVPEDEINAASAAETETD